MKTKKVPAILPKDRMKPEDKDAEIARLTRLLDDSCALILQAGVMGCASERLRDYYGARRSAERRNADDVYEPFKNT